MKHAGAMLLGLLLLPGSSPRAAGPADSLPARVTLEEALRLLNDVSPRTLAERATVEVAAAERVGARAHPNPSLSYDHLRLVSGESTGAETEHSLTLDQPLLLFGQRRARMDLADRNVEAEQSRVESALAQRRLEVRQAFVALVARQEGLRILQESLTELRRVEEVVRGRAQVGDRSPYDVLRVETERKALEVETMNAETDADDASGQLATLLGFPGWLPRAEGTLDPGDIPLDLDALWETAQQRRPALVELRKRQSAAQEELTVAHRERLPVPTLSAGGVQTEDVTGTSFLWGLSFPLPLFDRNKGAIARASAEIDAGTLALEAETAEARAEVERRLAILVARRRILGTLEEGVVQRVPDLRRMAEDAYREGRSDILDLLDASRSLKDLQLLHIHQLEITKEAEEDVIAAVGLDAPKVQG